MTTRAEIERLATLAERYAQWKKGYKILISHTWLAAMRERGETKEAAE